MPLYKSIAVSEITHVLIWKITESEKDLMTGLTLGEFSKKRVGLMKSQAHRCSYLAVRQLLAIAQYSDTDLTYLESGKPILSDGVEISITHSHDYAAIILSEQPVGIDIEKQRAKITSIAPKFISEKEAEYLENTDNEIENLTTIWCVKEAIYKLFNTPGLSFKQHIDVAPFEKGAPYTKAAVNYNDKVVFYHVDKMQFGDFICVYVTYS